MLFQSPEFLLGLLPAALIGFYALGAAGRPRAAIVWLVLLSFVFYGWWRPSDVWILALSIVANYALGLRIAATGSRALLILGVAGNLAVLGYFKYLIFFVEVLDAATGAGLSVGDVALPLAISFFTFQQIAYLVDAADGVSRERDFGRYALFISFFPQLIAGPIVHHKEMLPQFDRAGAFRARAEDFAVGAAVFAVGLFKKVVIADGLAPYADAAFADAAAGTPLTLVEAWGASMAFTFQIYFDFSGYSDMAVGLARLFGVRLPVNFASPYKAASIVEFWQRWHVTLTRFLTAYVYNPVSMALTRRRMREGLPLLRGRPTPGAFAVLVAFPTMLTMGIAGVWHGAGWQFIAFGLLHGTCLVANHAWRAFRHAGRGRPPPPSPAARAASVALTFACVVAAMVFFRAPDVPAALSILGGMAGLNGVVVPEQAARAAALVGADLSGWIPVGHTEHFGGRLALWLAALSVLVWGMPNVQTWIGPHGYGIGTETLRPPRLPLPVLSGWRPTAAQGAALGALSCFALLQAFSAAPQAFVYFDF
jgi:alginate O-acetyltransferase complex protein AlgI